MTMRARNAWIPIAALCAAVLVPGCTGNNIDDPSTGDVLMEVAATTANPITTTGTISGGDCVFDVTNWSSTLNDKPKNASAITSPFNDILLGHLTVTYAWDDPTIVTAPRTFNISGTVPANGSVIVSYPPVLFGDLDVVNMPGHSANTTLLFQGTTVGGDAVEATGVGAVLNVGGCLP
jgi:hypothetical protein